MTATLTEVWFENPPMGQRARLVTLPSETAGRSFVLEYINRPFTGQYAVPPHLHPTYSETFEILKGQARYKVGSKEMKAGPGETVVLPAGVTHVHPWSDSAEELHVRQTAIANPADLRGLTASLQGAITIFGLAGAGKVNSKGIPGLFQIAVIINATMPATYLAGAPIPVQRALLSGLAAIGRLLGYRTAYPEYGILTDRGVEWPVGSMTS
jgi:mannose-6-phosphate isomerase-like protein (cupin superfamily)